jgi:hypothetical protein
MQRFDLKRFRLDRKLTQKELAEILMCKQMVKDYGVSAKWLLTGFGRMFEEQK